MESSKKFMDENLQGEELEKFTEKFLAAKFDYDSEGLPNWFGPLACHMSHNLKLTIWHCVACTFVVARHAVWACQKSMLRRIECSMVTFVFVSANRKWQYPFTQNDFSRRNVLSYWVASEEET